MEDQLIGLCASAEQYWATLEGDFPTKEWISRGRALVASEQIWATLREDIPTWKNPQEMYIPPMPFSTLAPKEFALLMDTHPKFMHDSAIKNAATMYRVVRSNRPLAGSANLLGTLEHTTKPLILKTALSLAVLADNLPDDPRFKDVKILTWDKSLESLQKTPATTTGWYVTTVQAIDGSSPPAVILRDLLTDLCGGSQEAAVLALETMASMRHDNNETKDRNLLTEDVIYALQP